MSLVNRLLELAAQCRSPGRTGPVQLDEMVETCAAFGMNPNALRDALSAVVAERLMMWLLGDVPTTLNFLERAELVRARLARVGSLDLENGGEREVSLLVDKLVESHAAIVANTLSRKEGIASIPEPVLSAILSRQGFRCATCGVPVRSSVAKASQRFAEGVEPVLEADLDHTLPYYIGGNLGNVRVLCKPCNILKSDRMGMQEDALVMVGNHLRPKKRSSIERRAALWALEEARGCGMVGCGVGASDSVLWVRRARPSAPWVVWNLVTECSTHADQASRWIHEMPS